MADEPRARERISRSCALDSTPASKMLTCAAPSQPSSLMVGVTANSQLQFILRQACKPKRRPWLVLADWMPAGRVHRIRLKLTPRLHLLYGGWEC